jgi:exodeoxyribonuclease VII small subunit
MVNMNNMVHKAIEEMTFEDAMKELETIVKKIDSGQETLENSINAFERGALLKAYCEKKLQEAKFKLDKVVQNADGSKNLEPM